MSSYDDKFSRTFIGWLIRELLAALGFALLLVWLFVRHYHGQWCVQ